MKEIETLPQFAGAHSLRLGYFRKLSATFPYAIYYRLNDGVIVVRAVLDCRRDPQWLQKKLR
jgi:hypothetical protein